MLTAGASLDSMGTQLAKGVTSDLITKAFNAVAPACQPKIKKFTQSALDMITELVNPDQAGVFFTANFNVLCCFNSDVMNMVLSQCVALVQMASSLW